MIWDLIVLVFSFFLSYFVRFHELSSFFDSTVYRTLFFIIVLLSISVILFLQPYKSILRRNGNGEFKALFIFTLSNFFSLSVLLVLTKLSVLFSRFIIALTYALFFVFALIVRTLWKKHIKEKSLKSISDSDSKMLVVTDTSNVDKTIRMISENNYEMYEIVGLCIMDKDMKDEQISSYKVICNKDDLLSYVCVNWIDEVFVAMDYNDVPSYIFDGLATAGVSTDIAIEGINEFEGRDQAVKKLFNTTVLNSSIKIRSNGQIFLKRAMDIAGGIVGSLIALVLTLFIGPVIYAKSPGPIFYKQERIGQNGRRFYMYKFRSMVMDADKRKKELMEQNIVKDGMMFKIKDDPRIIPGIGNFIRQTSLDEFPQFFNVLKGDMSLVGTRPPTVDEWVKYKLEHRIRMAIKPGITGLWQVNGRSKITDFNKVIEYDTKYINNWSLLLDIEILFKTVKVLLSKREDEAM